MKSLLLILLVLTLTPAWSDTKVAVAKIVKGKVTLTTNNNVVELKEGEWVTSGSMVKTSNKSFVKLVFVDKSQMNVGPNSTMKIEKFLDKEPGVIDLVNGKIRSQVTKDYLQINEKNKSKLLIKTSNAVMGVRGTDFILSTNGKNTSAVLLEGEVVFNKLTTPNEKSPQALEAIVDRGVHLFPGEFSVVENSRSIPTVPALLNIHQRENLEKNGNFESDRAPSSSPNQDTKSSVVPEGLSGQVVSNDNSALKNEVSRFVTQAPIPVPSHHSNPDGYMKGEQLKPANGSFLHLDSGSIIAPGPKSVLDPNSNTYISSNSGSTATDGTYIPPRNMEITSSGKVLMVVNDQNGTTKTEVVRAPPIMNQADAVGGRGLATQPNDILNKGFNPNAADALKPAPNGGVPDIQNAVQTGANNFSQIRRFTIGP